MAESAAAEAPSGAAQVSEPPLSADPSAESPASPPPATAAETGLSVGEPALAPVADTAILTSPNAPPAVSGAALGMAGAGLLSHIQSTFWDPSLSADWDSEKPSQQCILRIKRDIMSIYKEPPPGMFVVPDPHDMTKIHAMITGPFDTPYEGGFFLFLFRCPPDYPIHPPRVKLITTGNNTVRFNPNFYRNGKVCLSILGTWTGPAWSPAQSISSVLISIQSLMTENPYHNEPGFEQERHPGDSKNYNECIRHETMRVAVCDMLDGKCPCPEALSTHLERNEATLTTRASWCDCRPSSSGCERSASWRRTTPTRTRTPAHRARTPTARAAPSSNSSNSSPTPSPTPFGALCAESRHFSSPLRTL
uniref:Ubiquitin-conjugating enzyme E2 Z n=1 Tax=Scleropages formosus TaxID=113540 RepID=A0A8C9QVJ0_SCLFO